MESARRPEGRKDCFFAKNYLRALEVSIIINIDSFLSYDKIENEGEDGNAQNQAHTGESKN